MAQLIHETTQATRPMAQTKLLKDFLATVRDVHATSGGTQETSFYTALNNLLDAAGLGLKPKAVSYTHLDVYKRQVISAMWSGLSPALPATDIAVKREFCRAPRHCLATAGVAATGRRAAALTALVAMQSAAAPGPRAKPLARFAGSDETQRRPGGSCRCGQFEADAPPAVRAERRAYLGLASAVGSQPMRHRTGRLLAAQGLQFGDRDVQPV